MQNIDVRNISIGQMQCFVLAAEFNSFSKAAEQLHVTQSTVSKAIISMENMMGLQLFIRKGNRIQRPIIFRKFSGIPRAKRGNTDSVCLPWTSCAL